MVASTLLLEGRLYSFWVKQLNQATFWAPWLSVHFSFQWVVREEKDNSGHVRLLLTHSSSLATLLYLVGTRRIAQGKAINTLCTRTTPVSSPPIPCHATNHASSWISHITSSPQFLIPIYQSPQASIIPLTFTFQLLHSSLSVSSHFYVFIYLRRVIGNTLFFTALGGVSFHSNIIN